MAYDFSYVILRTTIWLYKNSSLFLSWNRYTTAMNNKFLFRFYLYRDINFSALSYWIILCYSKPRTSFLNANHFRPLRLDFCLRKRIRCWYFKADNDGIWFLRGLDLFREIVFVFMTVLFLFCWSFVSFFFLFPSYRRNLYCFEN